MKPRRKKRRIARAAVRTPADRRGPRQVAIRALDELAGPFRMDVRERIGRTPERTRVDRAGVFDVARAFFQQHLQPK